MNNKYKGILLDLDDTLYDYEVAHSRAKAALLESFREKYGIDKELDSTYNKARKIINLELQASASSHNRLLYIQKMCEILGLNPLLHSLEIHSIYWDTFLESMSAFEGVFELLEKYKNRICLVSDFNAEIQYKKIKRLGIASFISAIVTSEEAGREKPHSNMFLLGLHKLGLGADEVCIIGDSFSKDILGAESLGMRSIWVNHRGRAAESKCFYSIEVGLLAMALKEI